MVQHRRQFVISLSLMTLFAIPASAAEPVSLHATPFSKIKTLFQVQVPGLLKSDNALENDLHLVQEDQDKHHVMHARMQQYYLGVPVFGGYAIVHARKPFMQMWNSRESVSVSMNGQLYQGLKADLGVPTKDFASRAADALQHFKEHYPQQQISDEAVHPMIYIDNDNRAHWAYQVSVLLTRQNNTPERPTAIIDAQSYQTYMTWNDMKTVRSHVNGGGFGGNLHTGIHQFGGDLPKLKITRDDALGICFMENPRTKVVDMMHRYQGRNSAMHFPCRDSARLEDNTFLTGYLGNGYDKTNGAYSPSNDALYSGDVIYDMYKSWYGLHPLENEGKTKQLIMRVHFGYAYDNAFWDGNQMTFGDGGLSFYPMVSLGVAAHEISHGFTERHANLIYVGQSGAINESFSDMASQAAEYFAYGKNDWTLGAELVKPRRGVEAFRYMDKPSRDGVSIDSAAQYRPDMDVHHTSGVYNRLFYLLATQPGWNVRQAFEVMLTANAYYWTPTSTFDEAACGVLEATKNLKYAIDDVKNAMDQVGVRYVTCGHESS